MLISSMAGTRISAIHMVVTSQQTLLVPQEILHLGLLYPEQGWMIITAAFNSPVEVPQFNMGHIVAYFVTRTVSDNLPAADFKSVNKSSEFLSRCGHIQSVEVCSSADYRLPTTFT